MPTASVSDELYGEPKRKAQVARLLSEAKQCSDDADMEELLGGDKSWLRNVARELRALAELLKKPVLV